jgi:serine/threonine protein phosphatase PrpC
VLSDEQMSEILAKNDAGQFSSEPGSSVCDALVHAANLGGGPDNITVILVRL